MPLATKQPKQRKAFERGFIGKKSKSRLPECSEAASVWGRARSAGAAVPAMIFQILARCRAIAAGRKRGELLGVGGHEERAAAAHRAATGQGVALARRVARGAPVGQAARAAAVAGARAKLEAARAARAPRQATGLPHPSTLTGMSAPAGSPSGLARERARIAAGGKAIAGHAKAAQGRERFARGEHDASGVYREGTTVKIRGTKTITNPVTGKGKVTVPVGTHHHGDRSGPIRDQQAMALAGKIPRASTSPTERQAAVAGARAKLEAARAARAPAKAPLRKPRPPEMVAARREIAGQLKGEYRKERGAILAHPAYHRESPALQGGKALPRSTYRTDVKKSQAEQRRLSNQFQITPEGKKLTNEQQTRIRLEAAGQAGARKGLREIFKAPAPAAAKPSLREQAAAHRAGKGTDYQRYRSLVERKVGHARNLEYERNQLIKHAGKDSEKGREFARLTKKIEQQRGNKSTKFSSIRERIDSNTGMVSKGFASTQAKPSLREQAAAHRAKKGTREQRIGKIQGSIKTKLEDISTKLQGFKGYNPAKEPLWARESALKARHEKTVPLSVKLQAQHRAGLEAEHAKKMRRLTNRIRKMKTA